jgi:hypothetical protein
MLLVDAAVVHYCCLPEQKPLFLYYVDFYMTKLVPVIENDRLRQTVALFFASSLQAHVHLHLENLEKFHGGEFSRLEIVAAVSSSLQATLPPPPNLVSSPTTKDQTRLCDHEDTRVFLVPSINCVLKRHYTVSGPWKDEIDKDERLYVSDRILPSVECITEILTYQILSGTSPYLGTLVGLVVSPMCIDLYVAHVPTRSGLRVKGLLTAHSIETMMRKLACGIITMHRHGIGHRDIKFENLLLTKAGDPVLVDFGSSGYGLRRTSPICTLTTRSIHLLALEEKNATLVSYDARTVDVWSFAVLYLELLLQVRLLHPDLYQGDTALIIRYYQDRIPFLLNRLADRTDVSLHVYTLIRQCLLSSSPADQPLMEDFA